MFIGDDLCKLELVGFFYDVGIWLVGIFDYLLFLVWFVCYYLDEYGLQSWSDEIYVMIVQYYKFICSDVFVEILVEVFCCVDWIDVFLGLLCFGVDCECICEINWCFFNVGFYVLLLGFSVCQLIIQLWWLFFMFRL